MEHLKLQFRPFSNYKLKYLEAIYSFSNAFIFLLIPLVYQTIFSYFSVSLNLKKKLLLLGLFLFFIFFLITTITHCLLIWLLACLLAGLVYYLLWHVVDPCLYSTDCLVIALESILLGHQRKCWGKLKTLK